MPTSVLLSTVSDEFRAYRDQPVRELTRHNVAVKFQERFKDLGHDTLDTYVAHVTRACIASATCAAPGAGELVALRSQAPSPSPQPLSRREGTPPSERLARELRARRERRELGVGDLRRHRRHAAIGARVQPFRRRRSRARRGWSRRPPRGVSTAFDATSMQPTSTSLPLRRPISSIGTRALRHSSETWSMRLAASAGKVSSYWRHSLAERRLPVGVGLDAIAVADVDGGPASKPLRRALERRNTPVGDLAHVDVEGGLVELHHVDPERIEFPRLLVQQPRRRRRRGLGGRVMLVGDRVDDGHRAGQGELELAPGVGARGARFDLVDGALSADRAGDGRHLGLVAVGADADRLPCGRNRCRRDWRGSRARNGCAPARRR